MLHPRILHFSKFFLVLLISSTSVFAQQPVEQETGLTARPSFRSEQTQSKNKVAGKTLPFVDDFSRDSHSPDPSLWQDNFVYINRTMAIDPITMGVATFDGLNESGQAYDPERNTTDTTDMLTSVPIDLSNTSGTTILRFYFQPGGLAEPPFNNDFLNLYFYSPVEQEWIKVWSESGSSSRPFQLEQIVIDSVIYLQDNFQFRFVCLGSPAGAFDVWHLDNVSLDDQSSLLDTTFNDPSFIKPINSLLGNYTSVPWFHYTTFNQDVLNKDQLTLRYRRNEYILDAPDLSLFLEHFRLSLNGVTLRDSTPSLSGLDDTHLPNTINDYPQGLSDFRIPLGLFPTDEFQLDFFATYTGALGQQTQNDTLYHTQIFKNYYAYDDGSAERSYKVDFNPGGFIVTEYNLLTDQDSTELKGLYIYFIPGLSDILENEFTIVVISKNPQGLPGQILYESDSSYVPSYSARNFYLPYVLDTTKGPVKVKGSVFIGIRQKKADPITIGLDKNNVIPTSSFYGTLSNFNQSLVQGTIMMRPFFEYLPRDISVVENPVTNASGFHIFPNPNQGRFKVETENTEANEELTYTLFSLSGQQVAAGRLINASIEAGNLKDGVYILQLTSSMPHKHYNTQKVIISH